MVKRGFRFGAGAALALLVIVCLIPVAILAVQTVLELAGVG